MTGPTPATGAPQIETLLQKWKVTEWRDGAVFRTELVGTEWRPMGTLSSTTLDGTTYVYSPMPTSYEGQTIRRIKPNTTTEGTHDHG